MRFRASSVCIALLAAERAAKETHDDGITVLCGECWQIGGAPGTQDQPGSLDHAPAFLSS
jgi:hypothetical protein